MDTHSTHHVNFKILQGKRKDFKNFDGFRITMALNFNKILKSRVKMGHCLKNSEKKEDDNF